MSSSSLHSVFGSVVIAFPFSLIGGKGFKFEGIKESSQDSLNIPVTVDLKENIKLTISPGLITLVE